jgi:hypothetical protein
MANIVDPGPLVEARLRDLAARVEPQLDALRRDVHEAPTLREKANGRRRLAEAKKAYRAERREIKAILIAPICW